MNKPNRKKWPLKGHFLALPPSGLKFRPLFAKRKEVSEPLGCALTLFKSDHFGWDEVPK